MKGKWGDWGKHGDKIILGAYDPLGENICAVRVSRVSQSQSGAGIL